MRENLFFRVHMKYFYKKNKSKENHVNNKEEKTIIYIKNTVYILPVLSARIAPENQPLHFVA
jgi:hypothetical protein